MCSLPLLSLEAVQFSSTGTVIHVDRDFQLDAVFNNHDVSLNFVMQKPDGQSVHFIIPYQSSIIFHGLPVPKGTSAYLTRPDTKFSRLWKGGRAAKFLPFVMTGYIAHHVQEDYAI